MDFENGKHLDGQINRLKWNRARISCQSLAIDMLKTKKKRQTNGIGFPELNTAGLFSFVSLSQVFLISASFFPNIVPLLFWDSYFFSGPMFISLDSFFISNSLCLWFVAFFLLDRSCSPCFVATSHQSHGCFSSIPIQNTQNNHKRNRFHFAIALVHTHTHTLQFIL